MKIFITGAAGYIGSAVCRALVKTDHEVVGMTHSKEKAPRLREMGARPVVGDIRRPESYRDEAAACDVLIHAAFEYGPTGPEADRTAFETLVSAANKAKARRLIIYTSGVWVLGAKRKSPADEESAPAPLPIVAWRPEQEKRVLDSAWGLVSAAVVRPGCVYGDRGGLYGKMIRSAEETRAIDLVGDGSNCWSSVYLDDLGELYRLIVERFPRKAVYHGTDGAAEPLKEVAEALLDAAGGGEVRFQGLDAARESLGAFADGLALDQRVSSEKTKAELGWRPSLTSVSKNAMCLLEQWRELAGPLSVA